jgi:hypothetical protein
MNPVPLSDPPITPDPYDRAWERLISSVVPQNELASLLDTIFSNDKVANTVRSLQGNEVQTFIDVIDTVCHHALLTPENGLIELCFNLLHSIVRHWTALISPHASEGDP